MQKNFKTLKHLADDFSRLISGCVCTDKNGKILSLEKGTDSALKLMKGVNKKNKSIFLVGNGGSAAVASHAITDLTNLAGISSLTLHEPSLLTCMTNDYGYETAFSRILESRGKKDDLFVAISSSGRSKNILNSVNSARKLGMKVITLSGFDKNNPLRNKGDLNYWLNSKDYCPVEIGHLFILHDLAVRMKKD